MSVTDSKASWMGFKIQNNKKQSYKTVQKTLASLMYSVSEKWKMNDTSF